MATKTIETRAQEALRAAKKLAEEGANWIDVHNAMFGIGGKCSSLFPTRSERVQFAATKEHAQIMELLGKLPRAKDGPDPEKFSGEFRVRLPKAIHAALAAEATNEKVSLNQFIVAKLCVQLREAL